MTEQQPKINTAEKSQRERARGKNEETELLHWYTDIKNYLEHGGLELSMADAVVLRQMIREAHEDNKQALNSESKTWTGPEGMVRWLFHYYGVNLNEVQSDNALFPISTEEIAQLLKRYRRENELI